MLDGLRDDVGVDARALATARPARKRAIRWRVERRRLGSRVRAQLAAACSAPFRPDRASSTLAGLDDRDRDARTARARRAATSANASSACFDAAYGPRKGSALRPPIEPMRTTRPRARRSAGSSAWSTATCPTTFTSSWRRSSSSGTSSSGAAIAMPALSTSPWSSEPTASAAAAICAASVTSSSTGSMPCSRSAFASAARCARRRARASQPVPAATPTRARYRTTHR